MREKGYDEQKKRQSLRTTESYYNDNEFGDWEIANSRCEFSDERELEFYETRLLELIRRNGGTPHFEGRRPLQKDCFEEPARLPYTNKNSFWARWQMAKTKMLDPKLGKAVWQRRGEKQCTIIWDPKS